jgi:hypothetical protein
MALSSESHISVSDEGTYEREKGEKKMKESKEEAE